MKPIDLIAYGLMFIASLVWTSALYGTFGLSRIVAVGLGVILGPITVISASYAISEYLHRKS